MKGYHSSPVRNEASIDAEGLTPFWGWGTNGKGRAWQHNPVHLAEDSPHDSFIGELCGDEEDNYEVVNYEVDLNYLTVQTGEDGPGTLKVFEWIEPSRLKKITRSRDGVITRRY